MTRLKVELVQRLAHASKEMDDSVRVYQDFLDTPLPQSVLLAHSYKELLEKLVCVVYVYDEWMCAVLHLVKGNLTSLPYYYIEDKKIV